MKRMLVLTAVAVLAFSGLALATADPDPDGMGFYFEVYPGGIGVPTEWPTSAGDNFCVVDQAAGFVEVHALLVITNGSEPGVAAWEANFVITSNANSTFPVAYAPGSVPIVAGDDYQVGVGASPVPFTGGNAVVADVGLLWYGGLAAATCSISLQGVPGSTSFADGPGYAYSAGSGVPCQPMFGAWGDVAWINGECGTIANENLTWGAVKSLY